MQIIALKNFTIFIVSESLQACNYIKKRLQHRYFPVNIAKVLRTAFFIEHIWSMLLNSIWFPLRSCSFE